MLKGNYLNLTFICAVSHTAQVPAQHVGVLLLVQDP